MTPTLLTWVSEQEVIAARATPGVQANIYETDDGIYLTWKNPFNGNPETIASFWWPTHPPEETEKVEAWFENSARMFASARTAHHQCDHCNGQIAQYGRVVQK